MHIVIIASGFSRRMGQNKLLVPLQGKPVIQWVIDTAKKVETCVTVVYREPEIHDIADASAVNTLYNPFAFLGQSAAVRLGVESLLPAKSVLFLSGDQPFIREQTLRAMERVYRENNADIVCASWKGERTSPTLFSSRMTTKLMTLEGDQGGRALIDPSLYHVVYQELSNIEETWDIDTADGLLRAEKAFHQR